MADMHRDMIPTNERVVFHVLQHEHYCAVLEGYPYPTPVFRIRRDPAGSETPSEGEQKPHGRWRVEIEYDLRFTPEMFAHTDVLEYMVEAPSYIEQDTITEVRTSVSKLLLYWAARFPKGIPEKKAV